MTCLTRALPPPKLVAFQGHVKSGGVPRSVQFDFLGFIVIVLINRPLSSDSHAHHPIGLLEFFASVPTFEHDQLEVVMVRLSNSQCKNAVGDLPEVPQLDRSQLTDDCLLEKTKVTSVSSRTGANRLALCDSSASSFSRSSRIDSRSTAWNLLLGMASIFFLSTDIFSLSTSRFASSISLLTRTSSTFILTEASTFAFSVPAV